MLNAMKVMRSKDAKANFKSRLVIATFVVLFSLVPIRLPNAQADPELNPANQILAPYVKIISPQDGFLTNQSLVVVVIQYGNITSLILNGNEVAVSHGSNSVSVTFFLNKGTNTLTAIGRNKNRQASYSVQVTLDTIAPELTVLTPVDNFLTNESSVTVAGAQTDASSITANGLSAVLYHGEDVTDQQNATPAQPIDHQIHAGEGVDQWEHSQGFTPSANGELTKVSLPLAKVGDPNGNLQVEIQTDGLADVPDQSYGLENRNSGTPLADESSNAKLAQGFTPAVSGGLNNISLPLKKIGLPSGNVTAEIREAISDQTLFSDYANSAHAITANGDAHSDSSESQFGGASAAFDGNGDYLSSPDSPDWQLGGSGGSVRFDGDGDYLSIPDSPDWQLGGGTGDFTIDFWIKYDNFSNYQALVSSLSPIVSPTNRFTLSQNPDGALNFYVVTEGTPVFNYNFAGGITNTNTWYHVALVRSGNNFLFFVNGNLVDSVIESIAMPDVPDILTIGRQAFETNPRYFNGWLDEVRISNTARWTTNFTPPTQPYTADTNTKLLLHFNHDFTDVSPNPHSVTSAGNSAIDTSNFRFQGDFTIDCWARFSDISDHRGLMGQNEDLNNFWIFYWNTSTGLVFQSNVNGSATINDSIAWTPSVNTWYHLAVAKSGHTYRLFVDGTQIGSDYVNANSILNFGGVLDVGRAVTNSTFSFNGYMDEVRISDTARWTANFTPTESEYAADDNTKLLVHSNVVFKPGDTPIPNGTSSAVTESSLPVSFPDSGTGSHDIAAEGDAHVNLTQSQFGGASASFDGNGDYFSSPDSPDWQLGGAGGSAHFDGNEDYLSIPDSPDWQLGGGNGDFTVDFWVKYINFSGASDYQVIFSQTVNEVDTFMALTQDPDGKINFFAQDGAGNTHANKTFNASMTSDVWHHVALVRSNHDYTLYINGTSVGSYTPLTTTYPDYNVGFFIGRHEIGGPRYLKGYLDEFRISNTARWTANFTPPTAEYTSDTNTKLLLHLNTDFTDVSPNPHPVTSVGNTAIDTSNFRFQGDFTIESWVRFESLSVDRMFVIQESSGCDLWRFFWEDSQPTLQFSAYSNPSCTASIYMSRPWQPALNTWYHIAMVRTGDMYRMFVNGTQLGQAEINDNVIPNFGGPLKVGYSEGGNYSMHGWMDEVRISNSARWTANFTPPTSEYATDENTKLLLHFNETYVTKDFNFDTPPALTQGTPYFLVLSTTRALDSENYVMWGKDSYQSTYEPGLSFTGSNGTPAVWTPFGAQDFIFETNMHANRSDVPSNIVIANGTSIQKPESSLTNSYQTVDFTFNSNPELTAGTPYHIVLKSDRPMDSVNFVKWAGSGNAYPNGSRSQNQSNLPLVWEAPSEPSDLAFKTWMHPEGIVFNDQQYNPVNQNVSSILHADGTQGAWDQAQGFQPSIDSKLNQVTLYLKKTGNPTGAMTVQIRTDNSGVPSNEAVANGISEVIPESQISTSFEEVSFSFSRKPILSAHTQYHIVLTSTRPQGNADYMEWGSDNSDCAYQSGARSSNSEAAPNAWQQTLSNDFIFSTEAVYAGPSFQIEHVPLTEGENAIAVVAHDLATNQTTVNLHGVLDSIPPVLNMVPTLLERKGMTQTPYVFTAHIQDTNPTPVEYQFQLNGAVRQYYSSNPIFNYTPQPTESGNKTLTVKARDIAGEASQDIGIYFYRNPS